MIDLLIEEYFFRNNKFSLPETQGMGWSSTSEPDFPQSASSEGQELGCLQSIISEPAKKVDANIPGSESLTTPQGFSRKPPVPDSRSFPKVATCNNGSLGGETSNLPMRNPLNLPQPKI
ncbi:hypothetical protein DSO57_1021897 [Entomophthora muscae]|uniref:Uncharacterized protein n=1 Tax=Entomophthora muscae TaxID=34485 RepID=A0ACC2T3G2_9FUNG|nr:hypothetical protein DSO57_1021897 [Entomophthora muscae]